MTRQELMRQCRELVREEVRALRREYFAKELVRPCQSCGGLIKHGLSEVGHCGAMPFVAIVEAFIVEHGEATEQFPEFHRRHADLKVICHRCNRGNYPPAFIDFSRFT